MMLIALSFCSLWAAIWTQYFKCAPLFCKSNKSGVLIIPYYNKEIRVFQFTKFTQSCQLGGFEPRSVGHQNQFSCPPPHLHTIYSATTTSFSSVQLSRSVISNSLRPWTVALQASLSIINSRSPPKPMSVVSVMPSNDLILCRPLLLPLIFLSIRVFSNESALCIRWPKYWSFSFNISPSNEHPGLISFRMDWLDLFAVQGTLKSLLQHHSLKASVLQHSAFFIVELSHPYMTTGNIIALTRQTFVCKVMSLFFNMVSRLFITFLPRSKHLLMSWLQSPSAVILEPPKKVSHCFHCFPIYLPWSDQTGCHDLRFLNVEF